MSAFCKGCGREIVWAVIDDNGKRVPLDAHPEKRFVFIYGVPRDRVELKDVWLSHFATCPKADEFRKPPVK